MGWGTARFLFGMHDGARRGGERFPRKQSGKSEFKGRVGSANKPPSEREGDRVSGGRSPRAYGMIGDVEWIACLEITNDPE